MGFIFSGTPCTMHFPYNAIILGWSFSYNFFVKFFVKFYGKNNCEPQHAIPNLPYILCNTTLHTVSTNHIETADVFTILFESKPTKTIDFSSPMLLKLCYRQILEQLWLAANYTWYLQANKSRIISQLIRNFSGLCILHVMLFF